MVVPRSNLLSVATQLNAALVRLLRGMRAVDRAAGHTPARLGALSVIVFAGPCTLGRLAEAENVAGPTMTRIVDGLVELGLVERRPHPDGGRLVLIAPTASGRDLVHTAHQARLHLIRTALRRLSTDDRRAIVQAASALQALAEEVSAASVR